MSTHSTYCLVMAGGKGTRFWPESTASKPKQYMSILGGKSLIQQTLERFEGLVEAKDRYIVTVTEQKGICSEQCQNDISENGLIFEPSGRNTAPCVLLSIAHLMANGASENDVVCVVPADHVILNTKGFQETIEQAVTHSTAHGEITTIGITPHFPHTGYGYIQVGDELGEANKVSEFKEKPNRETAESYLKNGNYLWNAGMFVAPLGVFLEEFKQCAPSVYEHYEALLSAIGNEAKVAEIYNQIPEDSIDYAVMEKSSKVSVLPAKFDWNDLGSWDALESVCEKKENNIILNDDNELVTSNSQGNIVFAPKQFVALANIEDLIVVSTDDVLMVLPKSESQKVKDIYNLTKEKGLKALL